MRPAKLREHFAIVHPGNSGDSLQSLKQKRARFHSSGTLPKLGFGSTQKPLLEASYKVAYLIAKNKKPHTIDENMIKPCALQMIEVVLGKQQRKQIAEIPLSVDVTNSRILICQLMFGSTHGGTQEIDSALLTSVGWKN
jgi:hypothetical protein